MTAWECIRCSASAPGRWARSAGITQISKVVVCAALVSCLSTAALALTLDGPSGRIANATSNVPSFDTSAGGSASANATIDGERSSAPGGFVEWANNGPSGFVVATFSYTLNAPYNVKGFQLWNDRGQVDTGIEDFELAFLDSSGLQIGTYAGSASQPSDTLGVGPGEWFSFPAFQDVSEINLRIVSSFGVVSNQFREVVFSAECCNADTDGDGSVGGNDLQIFLPCMNQAAVPGHACEPADVNCDGWIDNSDVDVVMCELLTPGSPACCPDPSVSTASPGVFCIDGPGDGSDWSWQVDNLASVDVAGPTSPSTVVDLRNAYVDSITSSGIPGLGCVAGPGSACFTVTYPAPFQFWVGPPGGPVTCLVSSGVPGCPFNPMIYEEAFFPVPLPGLTTWGAAIAVLALTSAALVLVYRRRGAVGRAS